MFYDAVENNHGMKYDPFKALISPRPIGWISSISAAGEVNLAPYSFFNAVSQSPHVLMFSSAGRKDSVRNIEETGEFVCSLATGDLREEMNQTSFALPHGEDEMTFAGLQAAASKLIAPPRVARSPVALECKLLKSMVAPAPDGVDAPNTLIFGHVVGIHIDDDVIVDGIVDMEKIGVLSRMGYLDYAVVENIFAMGRPKR